ncbi:HK97 family phage prohead protease [Rathayibacter sp. AY1A7]|uniref:HK97 family phage prohead protease n=1 Tax=Rathayibacter sp. AY1A7 TaxID=2080524 RepID=UPI000CE74052|nr:HK97 family phage prohead protease [Rathayibacter sp. AY1A7]PPF21027.1 HK97 family phage prohead protease [Rathayibacter sp. AY1A7]
MPDTLTLPEQLRGEQERTWQSRAETDSSDAREVSGIAVPFDTEIGLPAFGFSEQFSRDCVFEDADRALLAYRHDAIVGRLTSTRSTDAGLEVTGTISRTATGDEVYTLAQDGVLDRFSVRFIPLEATETRDEATGQPAYTYTRVQLREVSLVPFPAYDGATITSVRSAPPAPERTTPTMTDTLSRADLESALQQQEQELSRSLETRFDALRQGSAGGATLGEQWRSQGEFLRAVADETPAALEFYRAYVGGTFPDSATPATWIASAIRLVEERRRVLNTFTRSALPAEGMRLDYHKLNTNSIVVQEQVAEGDDLAYGKVSLTTDSVPVKTYGGYTAMTLQEIQRSSTPILDTAMTAMDIAYAYRTEAVVKSFLAALIAQQRVAGNKVTLAADTDAIDWLDIIVDAYDLADTRGFSVAGLLASKDVFKSLYRLTDTTGRPMFTVSGQGVNSVGTLDVASLTAQAGPVTVTLLPNAAPKTATFYDPVAVTTWEQPGAPIQLQQDNIINLSRAFSKYGAMAVGSQFPTALIPVEFAA